MRKTRERLPIEARDSTKEEIIEMLGTFFKDVHGVALVFLFGSTATNRARRKSDVDIGVLFKTPSLSEAQPSLFGVSLFSLFSTIS